MIKNVCKPTCAIALVQNTKQNMPKDTNKKRVQDVCNPKNTINVCNRAYKCIIRYLYFI